MDVVEHGVAVPDVSGSTPECQLVPTAATTIRNDEQSTIGGKFKFFQMFQMNRQIAKIKFSDDDEIFDDERHQRTQPDGLFRTEPAAAVTAADDA
jgi:hypothetical protein